MFALLMRLLEFWTLLLPCGDRATVEVIRSLNYTTAAQSAQTLDLYLPTRREGPFPVVVVASGGMWITGGNRDYADICRYLAGSGIACAPIKYRHLPPLGFLDQSNDIKDAIRWVRTHAKEYGLDPDRIGLFGSSAGGHLAALAGFCTDGEGLSDDCDTGVSSEVSALFLLYGVYDLREASGLLLIRALAVDACLPPGENNALEFYSPASHIDGSEPTTCVMHGTRDSVVPIKQAQAIQKLLEQHNVAVELIAVDGAAHGFAKLAPWTRPILADAMLRFFGRTLQCESEAAVHAGRPRTPAHPDEFPELRQVDSPTSLRAGFRR